MDNTNSRIKTQNMSCLETGCFILSSSGDTGGHRFKTLLCQSQITELQGSFSASVQQAAEEAADFFDQCVPALLLRYTEKFSKADRDKGGFRKLVHNCQYHIHIDAKKPRSGHWTFSFCTIEANEQHNAKTIEATLNCVYIWEAI
jgi:hypothetical protein